MERRKKQNREDLILDPAENDVVGVSKRHGINNPYIQLANRYPFLTKDQEQMIFRFKEESPFSMEILYEPKFLRQFPEEEGDLVENLQYEAESTLHIAHLCNMKLVASVAQKYLGQGLSLDDLCSEGQPGLIRSLQKFDYKKGNRISTYAFPWIRQSIMRGIAERGKTIRIPEHSVDVIKVYYRQSRILEQELGRQPTNAELAQVMGIQEKRLEEVISGSLDPVSLNIPVGESEDGFQLKDIIVDENLVPTDLLVEKRMQRMEVRKFLSVLNEKELRVLALRFGIDEERERTLEEVGIEYGVTRERIRQIERNALAKVKNELQKAGIKSTGDLFTV